MQTHMGEATDRGATRAKTCTRMESWMLATVAAFLLSPTMAEAQDKVPTNMEIATEIEAAAASLHDRAERWADAATLYRAAAELREDGDSQGQKNLFVAANLFLETGRVGDAIAVLESAASRALASGDSEAAIERFADAALVALRAGLTREHQRLGYRITEVAVAPRLAHRVPR